MRTLKILAVLLTILMVTGLCACSEEKPEPTTSATQSLSSQPDTTVPTDHNECEISVTTCSLEVMNSSMEGEGELSLADDGTFILIGGQDVTLTAAELADAGIDGEDFTYRYQTKITGTWEIVDGQYVCSSGEYFATIIADEAYRSTLEAFVYSFADDQTSIDAHLAMLYDGEYAPYDLVYGFAYDLKMEVVAADNGFQVIRTEEYDGDGSRFAAYDHTDGKISTVTYYYAFGGISCIHYYEDGNVHHTDHYGADGNHAGTSYPDENGDS